MLTNCHYKCGTRWFCGVCSRQCRPFRWRPHSHTIMRPVNSNIANSCHDHSCEVGTSSNYIISTHNYWCISVTVATCCVGCEQSRCVEWQRIKAFVTGEVTVVGWCGCHTGLHDMAFWWLLNVSLLLWMLILLTCNICTCFISYEILRKVDKSVIIIVILPNGYTLCFEKEPDPQNSLA